MGRPTLRTAVIAAAASVSLVALATSAAAVEVPPAPSAVLGDVNYSGPPIDGFDEIAVPAFWLGIRPEAVPVTIDGFPTSFYPGTQYTSSAGTNVLVGPPDADDNGCACWAHNQLKWTDHGGWEKVKIGFSRNEAQWNWPRQDFHAALMHSGGKDCYSGSYSATYNSGPVYNTQNPPQFSSGYDTQWNNTWTLASGHAWYTDDGTKWAVESEADICKKF